MESENADDLLLFSSQEEVMEFLETWNKLALELDDDLNMVSDCADPPRLAHVRTEQYNSVSLG